MGSIHLFDTNAILNARIPTPQVRAPLCSQLARRLAAVNAFWGATLHMDPVQVIHDPSSPGPCTQEVDPDAIEEALSAYAWHGEPSHDAYDHVLELVLSGGPECAVARAKVLALLDAYFR